MRCRRRLRCRRGLRRITLLRLIVISSGIGLLISLILRRRWWRVHRALIEAGIDYRQEIRHHENDRDEKYKQRETEYQTDYRYHGKQRQEERHAEDDKLGYKRREEHFALETDGHLLRFFKRVKRPDLGSGDEYVWRESIFIGLDDRDDRPRDRDNAPNE